MAGKQQERLSAKQIALRDLELARMALARNSALVAEEYSPRALVARSMERHRAAWIAGAACAGLLAFRLLTGGGRGDDNARDFGAAPAKHRGLLGLLAVPLMTFGKKALMNYGSQFLQNWLHTSKSTQDNSPGPV
jgi:hypothetical protein